MRSIWDLPSEAFPRIQAAALGYPEFRRYYAGQAISVIGTWMQTVAAAWLVLQLSHNSAFALAAYGACQYGPTMLFGLVAGTLVDRAAHRDLLLLTQVVSTMGATLYAVLTDAHLITLPIVYLVAAALGINQAMLYVRRAPVLLGLFVLLAVAATFGANFNLVLPLFTRVALHSNADALGYLFAAQGVGALLGALTMTVAGRALLNPRRIIAGGIFFGGLEVLFLIQPSFIQALVILLAIGWSFALYSIGTNTMVQVLAPDGMQGRMVSLYATLFIGTTPIGNFFAGT